MFLALAHRQNRFDANQIPLLVVEIGFLIDFLI
jgi:hypothetical protein